jgi:mannosyltransferase OCH1-like enzyme
MALDTYGGVYLDTDMECFADMSPWLAGADLVLQDEVSRRAAD